MIELPQEIQKLKEYDNNYYSDQSLISDEEYDILRAEAKKKYPEHSYFREVSFSNDVKKDVKLEYIMGSLEKRHYYPDKKIGSYESGNDIETWLSKYSGSGFIVTHKIDGVSVMVTIENGEISHAELRGDGEIGSDVTDKVKIIFNNKNSINEYHKKEITKLVARGEISLDCDPRTLGYKNKRNSTSGILHRDDNKNCEHLKIIFYELVELKSDISYFKNILNDPDVNLKSEMHRLNILTAIFNKNRVSEIMIIPEKNIRYDELGKTLIKWVEEFDRKEYDIDGLVITPIYSNRENVKIPKNKVAFKAPSTYKETVITNIEWNVSRTGKIIPIVHFQPVEINGATLGKATGFNHQFMDEYDIGIGRTIKVFRSEEVIPYIVANKILSSDKHFFKDIKECPSCKSILIKESVHLVCNNFNCPAKVLKKICHYFISLGLEEFSEKMFQTLKAESVFDVFNIKSEDIQKIEGWGKKSSDDFVKRIQELKITKPDLFLIALDIPFLGKTFSKILVSKFDFNELISGKITTDQLKLIEGISEKKANYIYNGIKTNQEFIQKLFNYGVQIKMENKSDKLKGMSFCITGKLSKTRDQIVKDIEEAGGIFTGMKKNVILVCNEEESSSSKFKYAKKNENEIITEEKLYQIIQGD